MNRIRRIFILTVITLIVLVIAVPALTGLLVDWWWFKEIGFQVVFTTQLLTRVWLFLAVGALTAGVLYLNLRIAQQGVVPNPIVLRVGPSSPQLDVARTARRVSLPLVLVAGLLGGLGATALWSTVLQAMHATPFGVTDPVFARDIGFYVFTLPLVSAVLGILSSLTFISLLLLLFVYWLRTDIIVRPRLVRIERSAGIHIAIVLATLMLLTAVRLWVVDSANLLYSTTGPLVGASYTDLHATLPALRLSAVVAALAAGTVVFGALRDRLPRYALLSIGGYIVV